MATSPRRVTDSNRPTAAARDLPPAAAGERLAHISPPGARQPGMVRSRTARTASFAPRRSCHLLRSCSPTNSKCKYRTPIRPRPPDHGSPSSAILVRAERGRDGGQGVDLGRDAGGDPVCRSPRPGTPARRAPSPATDPPAGTSAAAGTSPPSAPAIVRSGTSTPPPVPSAAHPARCRPRTPLPRSLGGGAPQPPRNVKK